MDRINETIARQIRSIRNARKMTLSEVALIAFGNENRREQISKLENEKTSATIATIEKLFAALNCELVIVPQEKSKAVKDLLNK